MSHRPRCMLMMALTDFKGIETDPRWTIEPRNEETFDRLWGSPLRKPPLNFLGSVSEAIENPDYDMYESYYWLLPNKHEPIKTLGDVINWPDDDGVFGYVIEQVHYDSPILWAMRSLWPDNCCGFYELPKMDKDKLNRFSEYRDLKRIEKGEKVTDYTRAKISDFKFSMDNEWLYDSYLEYMSMYWDYTRYVFEYCLGMQVTPREFKLGLYWQWT